MSLSMFDLTDRVAIVTGSGRGIGKAIALGFADAGANVVVCARTLADIEDTAARVRAKGRKALAVVTDTRNVDQVASMVQKALAYFGKIDILVNNAGGGVGGDVDIRRMTFEDWKAAIDLNLNSTFICTKAVSEHMIKRKTGNIINMSSIVGTGPFGVYTNYSAAKAAIISFTQLQAIPFAADNIRINAIAPGYIETSSALAQRIKNDAEFRKTFLERIPLGRIGKPEDVVGAAIYLASDASSYVTGSTIVVSGAISTRGR
ncbi:MAG: glucose 1-dehydrogenase [Chloroflexi bacterium]|nr:glucose 1-dehydrogenase [Chloroflexota bacterium]